MNTCKSCHAGLDWCLTCNAYHCECKNQMNEDCEF